jgi:hypothetical protein
MWAVQGRIEKCIQNVRKPEGKRSFTRPRYRQEDKILSSHLYLQSTSPCPIKILI